MGKYFVSSTTSICTKIALILDSVSTLTMVVFLCFLEPIVSALETTFNKYDGNDFIVNSDYYDLIQVFLIVVTTLSVVFLIFNIYFFMKLINKKVSVETAKKISVYQVVFGAISLGANTISAILYLISGMNSHTNLSKQAVKPRIGEY